MASTQVVRKFGRQEKYSLAEEKKLGELDKNIPSPLCCLFQPPCLIYFAVFSNVHLLRPLFIWGQRVVALRMISYTRFYLQ